MSEIYLLAEIKAKPGKNTALQNLLAELVVHSRKETTNQAYELYQDSEDDHLFIMREIWASAEALKAHEKTIHFQSFLSGAKELDALDSLVGHSMHKLA